MLRELIDRIIKELDPPTLVAEDDGVNSDCGIIKESAKLRLSFLNPDYHSSFTTTSF